MAAAADGCTLVAVWIVHTVCPRNRSTGHCIVDRRICVGVRSLLDGLSISSARTSALNYAADIISRVVGKLEMVFDTYSNSQRIKGNNTITRIWRDHLKRRLDDLGGDYTHSFEVVLDLRKYFLACPWYEAYDFIEFVAKQDNAYFCPVFNHVLEREAAGYRFVRGVLSPIVSEKEIASIETATSYADRFKPVTAHLSTSLQHLSDRIFPDFRNSIKESISAVEAACQIIMEDPRATLGQAVKKLEDSGVKLHPAFEGALQKMYGYTSDAEGIRHALLGESTLDSDDARFMLVSCSAFVNYLKAKSSKSSS
jgi:hypothetical protein